MAKSAAGIAMGTAQDYGSQASDIGSMLVPELTKEALHPTGFNPADLNAMLVAGEQGAGGANAGIAGEAGLRAARSRNTGSLSAILDEASRGKTRQLSENALGVQSENAREKERQRQAGLTGLEGVRGGDIHAQLQAQGLVPEDINAWVKAASREPTMFQDVLGSINALSGSKAGGKIGL
jgi:hypothetical protein